MKIAFLGIGEMGIGMAENILAKNGALIFWNRTKDKPHVQELAEKGGELRQTVEEAVEGAEYVCINLTNDKAVWAVCEQVLPAVKRGTVIMDFSTIAPESACELAEKFSARGCTFLDCPVSGGSAGARAGTLAIMAGGDRAGFEQARPVLEMCGTNVRYMGASGAGQKAKLINQLLTWVNQAVVCEAMLLAEKVGIDLTALNKVLLTSWGRSWMLERSVERYIIPRDFESPSGVELMVKDYNLILKMAEKAGCAIPIAVEAKKPYDIAMESGLAKKDPSVILEVMERYNTHGGREGAHEK